MAVTECGIRENLAKHYGQKSAPARLEGVGGEAGQTPIFFTQAGNSGLNYSLSIIPPWACGAGPDSQHDSGVDVMKHISNTQTSRSHAEREQHDRINTLLDQALELTFPCSDPVAITIDGIYDVLRCKTTTDSGAKREPAVSFKRLRGRA